MGGGQTAQVTKYDGVQVQSALLGTCIPKGWGTFMVGANILWYGGFKAKAQKSSGGKGGGSSTSYTYSASLVMGICRGAIAGIRNVYKDSSVYVPKGGSTALQQVGLTLFTGAIGQADWSYLDNNFASQAIGYSGIAYVAAANYALGSSATPPNHSFEVQTTTRAVVSGSTLDDANPKDILDDLLPSVPFWNPSWTGDLSNWGNYCLAAGLLLSPYMDNQRQASDMVTEILTATNSNCFFADGVFQVTPYGDTTVTGNGVTWTPDLTPIYDFTLDDFIPASQGDDPVTVDIKRQADAYNYVQVEYLDRSNSYRTNIQPAEDAANIAQYGRRPNQSPTSLHSICLSSTAATVAQLLVQRSANIRKTFKWRAGEHFGLLNCMDLVTLTTKRMTRQLVRITEMDDTSGDIEFTAEEVPVGAASAPLLSRQPLAGYVPDTQIDPGGVEANLLLWSEDLTQSAWAKTNMSVTADATTEPLFGATSADKIIPTTTNGAHYIEQAFPFFEGLNYTYTVFVKAAELHIGNVELNDNAGNLVAIYFDATAGTIIPSTYGSAVLVGSDIQSAGNGWWQVAVCASFPASTSLNAVLQVLDDSGNASYAGDGTSGLYAWGHQVKQGVDVPDYCYTGANYATPILFNAPAVLVNGVQNEIWAAAAGGANWGGANVWVSIDGTNYQEVGTITGPARYGRLVNAVAAGADPDTTDTFTVDLGQSTGVLTSASQTTANASGSLSILGSELISYSTANLVAQNRYNLTTYTRRGVMGTPNESHSASEIFVRLDDAVFALPYMSTTVGETVYVKFQSFNIYGAAVQNISDCIAYTIVPTPSSAGMAVGVNRVVLSLFEAGASQGWTVSGTTSSQSKAVATTSGYPTLTATGTASAANQTLSIAQTTPFPVTAGERLSAAALVGLTGPASAVLSVQFYNASGGALTPATIASFSSATFPATEETFISAPPNAVTASLSLVATSTGSGSVSISLAHPMVAAATANQASYPNFVAGPNAEQGATVGAQSGTNLWDSVGVLLGDGAIKNVAVPAGGFNRVALSQFEKGTAYWTDIDNPSGNYSSIGQAASTSGGYTFLSTSGTASGANQQLRTHSSVNFPVVAGETLYISGLIQTSNCTVAVGVGFINSSGVEFSPAYTTYISGGPNPWTPEATTCVVPAGAVQAFFAISAYSVAAGTVIYNLAQPMACGVQAGQTTFPAFNAGANATNGADVTGQNTAQAIVGQQAWATAVITYSGTAPGSANVGDIWIDTAVTPNIWQRWSGSAWVPTTPTNTNQLADGAGLGNTALWGSVSSRPSNLAALTGSEPIQNGILQSALTGGSVVPLQSAGITGQGALATLSNVGSPQILAGVLAGDIVRLVMNANVSAGVYVTVTADVIPMYDTSTHMVAAFGFSGQINSSAVGVNGFDSTMPAPASWTAGQWFYVYAISNGSTAGLIMSTNSGIPNMPSGYTYLQRLGAVLSAGPVGNLYPTVQRGQRAQIIVGSGGMSAAQKLVSGSVGSGSSYSAYAVRGVIAPPTSTGIDCLLTCPGGYLAYVAPNANYGTSSTSPPYASCSFNNVTAQVYQRFSMELESDNIYYTANSTGAALYITGWTDNVAA